MKSNLQNHVPANYNEYKFHVSRENLAYVLDVLRSLYGGSDPFPEGIVDSIYYDTLDGHCFQQCVNGNSQKTKFRVRGYGDGHFHQLHQKDKNLLTVDKKKQRIEPVSLQGFVAPEWYQFKAVGEDKNFKAISSVADQYGLLQPAIRVRYKRYRFRAYDYRMTLDTNIQVMGFANGFDFRDSYGVLPHHVLEIKTVDPRPHLPLLGLSRLPQISFSKFMLGLNLLKTGDVDFN